MDAGILDVILKHIGDHFGKVGIAVAVVVIFVMLWKSVKQPKSEQPTQENNTHPTIVINGDNSGQVAGRDINNNKQVSNGDDRAKEQ